VDIDARGDLGNEYRQDQRIQQYQRLAPARHQRGRGLHAENRRVDHDEQQNAALERWPFDELAEATAARFRMCYLHDAYLSVDRCPGRRLAGAR